MFFDKETGQHYRQPWKNKRQGKRQSRVPPSPVETRVVEKKYLLLRSLFEFRLSLVLNA
jgi:hypothetical protein